MIKKRNTARPSAIWTMADMIGPEELMFSLEALNEHIYNFFKMDKQDPKSPLIARKKLLAGYAIPHIAISNRICQENHITDTWFDIVLDSMARTNGLDETLDIRYIGIGWDPTAALDGDSALLDESYRFEVDILDRDGLTLHMGKFLDPSEGNNQNHVILSIDDADTITLGATAWPAVGRKMRIFTGPNANTDYTDVTLTAVDNGTGVISFTPALSPVPSTPYTTALLHCEYGFFAGSGASESINTGKLLNRLVADRYKITGVSSIYHAEFTLARG